MTTKTTTQTAEVTADHLVANFGEAWGADGQLLTHAETTEAIANRQGWFDRQGRWVNYARMMQEARLILATK